MKIKKILISQPRPELERSPYFEIARNFNVQVDFRPFIQIESIPAKEFRKNRIDILSYSAVIMTSKNAVDNYFRICNEMRVIVPETMKYFCISEATAYYLQKYIQFRKRKIFYSNFSFADLVDIIKKKHKEEKFLLPCTDMPNDEYTELLDKEGIRYVKAPLYKAIYSNLTDIKMDEYDLLVLFSSAGITSLLNSFPGFRQNKTLIAAFGEQTAKAVIHAGLNLHIHAPQPQAPSMAMALEQFLKGEQKDRHWQPVTLSLKNIEEMAPEKKFPPRKNKRVAKPKETPVKEPKSVNPNGAFVKVNSTKNAQNTKPVPKKIISKPAVKKPTRNIATISKPAAKKQNKPVTVNNKKTVHKKNTKQVAKKTPAKKHLQKKRKR